jgi:hypothetical protein
MLTPHGGHFGQAPERPFCSPTSLVNDKGRSRWAAFVKESRVWHRSGHQHLQALSATSAPNGVVVLYKPNARM